MRGYDINRPVVVEVDCSKEIGELPHLWNSIGYDEINWTYSARGREVFKKLGEEVIEQPYYVRNHNTFTSGNTQAYPAGGSTNVYREDAQGNPIYNWETIDKVYDVFVVNGFRALIELGFLPFDLVPPSEAESAEFRPGQDLGKEPYEGGKWKLPPKDYKKWEALVEAFVTHLVDRYGEYDVKDWYLELWNEPDIPNYWRGTVQEYCKLYDHSVAGATRAFPDIKIGGPATTGNGQEFLRAFLQHCTQGTNYVTGRKGTRLDFISFHTKGANFSPRRSYGQPVETNSPSLLKMMTEIHRNVEVMAQFPELKGLPVFVDECDPAVGTIYGIYDNSNFNFNNTEYYPAFVAALVGQIMELNRRVAMPVTMITHWAFYFEAKRIFEGNRALFTNENIAAPIVAGLKMLGGLGTRQVTLTSSGARSVFEPGYTPQTTVFDGLAAINDAPDGRTSVTVLVWNHVDDWTLEGQKQVSLRIKALPFQPGELVRVRHWRIDGEHSNAYAEWVRQGRPEEPDWEQLERLTASEKLALLEEPLKQAVSQDGSLWLDFTLPAHGLSLIDIEQFEFEVKDISDRFYNDAYGNY